MTNSFAKNGKTWIIVILGAARGYYCATLVEAWAVNVLCSNLLRCMPS